MQKLMLSPNVDVTGMDLSVGEKVSKINVFHYLPRRELCYLQGFEMPHFTEQLGRQYSEWVVRKGPARKQKLSEKEFLLFNNLIFRISLEG